MFRSLANSDLSFVAKLHSPAGLLFSYQPARTEKSPVCDTHAQPPAAFSTITYHNTPGIEGNLPMPYVTAPHLTERGGAGHPAPVLDCWSKAGAARWPEGVEGKDARRSSLPDRRIPRQAAPPSLLKITKTLCHHARRLRILYQAALKSSPPSF
ncbi:hypothetical protein Landi51_10362 [Colletotrichum acutatum]